MCGFPTTEPEGLESQYKHRHWLYTRGLLVILMARTLMTVFYWAHTVCQAWVKWIIYNHCASTKDAGFYQLPFPHNKTDAQGFKQLSKGHSARKWWSWDFNQDPIDWLMDCLKFVFKTTNEQQWQSKPHWSPWWLLGYQLITLRFDKWEKRVSPFLYKVYIH